MLDHPTLKAELNDQEFLATKGLVFTRVIERIDHVGVIVADLQVAAATMRDVLGFSVAAVVERPTLRALFFSCGRAEIELIELLDEQERRARLGEAVARIEHIAFAVDDIDATYRALRERGVATKDLPRTVERYRTFFTRPDSFDGIAYQFVQRGPAPADASYD